MDDIRLTTPDDDGRSGGSGAGGGVPPGIRIGIEGAAACVTLDRPGAMNALTDAMRATIARSMPRWERDPQVYAVVIDAVPGRAFCAGGDVREIVDLARTDMAATRKSLAGEYGLNWALDCFTKPTVSLIDGIVMGGGVGLTQYGTHRVAGDGYRFAMPETGIGLFPDDGVCHVFARMPDAIGMYLALTGRAIGPADAYALGLVTHCIPASEFAQVRAALVDADPVDPVLDGRHVTPSPGELEPLRPVIARCFGRDSVEEIIAALMGETGTHAPWAATVAEELRGRAPLSLKVTHRHVREAAGKDLKAVLETDYRLACRFLLDTDFHEGVRALLVDRDRRPRWQPPRLEDVTAAMVDGYFAPLGVDEIVLPSRTDLQGFAR